MLAVRRVTRWASVLTASTLLLGFGTTMARADDITPAQASVVLGVPGSTNVQVTLVAADDVGWNGDNPPAPLCDLRSTSTQGHFVDVSVTSSDTSVATVSPASYEFTACGQSFQVTITAVNCGTATVSINDVRDRTAGGHNATINNGSIAVTVDGCAPEEPPPSFCAQPAAPAWAAAILQANGIKPNSAVGKNLISRTANALLKGASFPDYRSGHNPAVEQVNKVDQGPYADSVWAFLGQFTSVPIGPSGAARPGWTCTSP